MSDKKTIRMGVLIPKRFFEECGGLLQQAGFIFESMSDNEILLNGFGRMVMAGGEAIVIHLRAIDKPRLDEILSRFPLSKESKKQTLKPRGERRRDERI